MHNTMQISINRLMEIPKRLEKFFCGEYQKKFFFEFRQTKWFYARFTGL